MAGNIQATLAWLGESSRLILQVHLSSGQGGRERLGPEEGGESDGGRAQISHNFVRQGREGEQWLGEKPPWDWSYMNEEESSLQLIPLIDLSSSSCRYTAIKGYSMDRTPRPVIFIDLFCDSYILLKSSCMFHSFRSHIVLREYVC